MIKIVFVHLVLITLRNDNCLKTAADSRLLNDGVEGGQHILINGKPKTWWIIRFLVCHCLKTQISKYTFMDVEKRPGAWIWSCGAIRRNKVTAQIQGKPEETNCWFTFKGWVLSTLCLTHQQLWGKKISNIPNIGLFGSQ